MQDPSPPANPSNAAATLPNPSRSSHHRRAQSEVNFRLPDDLDLGPDPFDAPSGSFEELGSEDDLFCTYMDMEKLGSGGGGRSNLMNLDGSSSFSLENNVNAGGEGEKSSGGIMRPRHRHCNSMDSSTSLFNSSSNNSESIEAKKAMAPDKLAELWNLDPKRAKRYLTRLST